MRPRPRPDEGDVPDGTIPREEEEKEVGGREPVEGDGAPREMETVSDYARGDARGGGGGSSTP